MYGKNPLPEGRRCTRTRGVKRGKKREFRKIALLGGSASNLKGGQKKNVRKPATHRGGNSLGNREGKRGGDSRAIEGRGKKKKALPPEPIRYLSTGGKPHLPYLRREKNVRPEGKEGVSLL